MGSIFISDRYSHMFGQEILERVYPEELREVESILTTTEVTRTKICREEKRFGELIFSGKDFNAPLAAGLGAEGWKKRRVIYPGQTDYWFEVDFCKGKVGLEIQFGKYFAVQKDLYNLLYLFGLDEEKRIDVGIIVIPSDNLQPNMPLGVGKFGSVVTAIRSHSRNDPPFPALLLGIEVAE